MPDHVKLDIPFLYPLTYVPTGSSRPRDAMVSDTVSVMVPVATSAEVPAAISFAAPEIRHLRSHEGGLYTLHKDETGATLAPGTSIAEGDFDTAFSILYPEGKPVSPAQARLRTGPRPSAASVLSDGRDAMVAEVLDRAGRLLFVDGALWRPTQVPRLNISHKNQAKWSVSNSDGKVAGVSYTADRIDAFNDLVRAFKSQAGIKVDGNVFAPVIFDWDVADEAEVAHNADYMAGLVISSCGESIHTLDAAFIRRLAGLAKTRISLRDDPSPETARVVHATMKELLPQFDAERYIWARKHLINGLAAIEASRDYRHEALDDDDVAALSMGGGL